MSRACVNDIRHKQAGVPFVSHTVTTESFLISTFSLYLGLIISEDTNYE